MNRCQRPMYYQGNGCEPPPGMSPMMQNMQPMAQPMPITNCVMDSEASCIDQMPLAMAYVPMQRWGATYDPETALVKGTIFPDLDLPFCGCGSGVRQYG